MAFTLRVTQVGTEAEEFTFDTGEARLGRTADNDVVIKDPSSSRSHARVYEEEGRFFVEDMKSANGTKLNAKTVKAPLELKSGDRITIGDVTLEFVTADSNDTVLGAPSSTVDDAASEPEEDPNATMLKPPSKPAAAVIARAKKPPPRRVTPPPEEAEPPADEPEEEPAEEPAAEEPAEEEEEVGESTKNFAVPPPKALQKRPAALPARPSRALATTASKDEPAALSAAERARNRRELQKSTSGKAMLLWSDLPLPGKIAVGVLGGGAAIAMLVLLVIAVIPKRVDKKVEQLTLSPNGEPIPESYGAGDDVDFERPDMKSFTFSFQSPTKIVGVLHYQARDCTKEEVSIELNGAPLGHVPPDTVEVAQRQLEVVLPSTQLKLNDDNEIVFDNVNNPPGEDTWRIWNVWVEVFPIPEMSAEEAGRRAKEDLERAAKMYELRAVGAMNLFRSWKQYRDAWLLLEATPNRPPELLEIARSRMREIRPELDRKCSGMLVDYQKEINQKYPNMANARQVLQNIPAHFEKEHPCYGMSRGLLRSLEDLSGAE
ncbi:MAG: FHA domain-containing protein [Archangium sp.]|nr:FHA domain-containing protein [Archangium sp.]